MQAGLFGDQFPPEDHDVSGDTYDWDVNYLTECSNAANDLRDKAFFLGLNEIGGLLECVRSNCHETLMAMIVARAGDTDLRSWLDMAQRLLDPQHENA